MEPTYRPISEEERNLAYRGLPSRPILKATTSSQPVTQPRCMSTVGQHPIVAMWDSTKPLPNLILENLHGTDLLAIDIVRLGCSPNEIGKPPTNDPVVMLITISEDSTTDAEALFHTACSCKAALGLHGITDVEVEMKASKLVRAKSEEAISHDN